MEMREPTMWEEFNAEFTAEFPHWELALKEHDDRENELVVTEADLEIGEPAYMQEILDFERYGPPFGKNYSRHHMACHVHF